MTNKTKQQTIKSIIALALLLLVGCDTMMGQSAENITCTIAYRSAVTEPIEREEKLIFGGTDDKQTVVFANAIFHAQFADGAADGERSLRLWVTDSAETATYQSNLYQLASNTLPTNQFTGGHGFTGLSCGYVDSAEVQYWCMMQ